MFYCDDCAKERGWFMTFFKSLGPCELCGVKKLCNDLPSSKVTDGTRSRPILDPNCTEEIDLSVEEECI